MIIATIILSTTDIVRLPVASVSVYRLTLLLTTFIAIIYIIKTGKIRKGRYLYFLVLLSVSPLAYYISTNKEWAFSFMLNDFMGILIVFLVSNFFCYKDKDILMKAFIQSQFFTIAFSVYSVVMYYFRGGIPQNISFLKIFSITLSEEFLRRGTISNQIRLSLPYATPPHLSIIMAIALCILFFNKKLFEKRVRYILMLLFSIILLMTNSRTGIAAGLLIVLLSALIKFNYKFNVRRIIIIICGIAISFVALVLFNIEYVDKLISRFIIKDITQDRHLLVPLEGILIWMSSLKNFVIGIGYGSSINLPGKYTILPPYFLNSFVTLIAEKGIIGLLLVIEFIRLFIVGLRKIRPKQLLGSLNAIWHAYLIAFTSFMFYEAKQNISIWIIISIIYMIDQRKYLSSEV